MSVIFMTGLHRPGGRLSGSVLKVGDAWTVLDGDDINGASRREIKAIHREEIKRKLFFFMMTEQK